MKWISFILLASWPILSSCDNGPIVKTPLGPILGKVHTSRKKLEFYSFRGIRYAEPPLQNLRFKPPVPVRPWNETLDATKDGPACIQEAYWEFTSEDCLRLNVYTHHLDSNQIRPVLVYIHGGGFEAFTSQSEWLSPEYLMDHDIVIVTINYRLSILGFFSTGDEHAPGNYGMKDQVEALRWVKNNIHAFGGGTNKVTIAGDEAGAASVIFHLLSPMSKGLFQGAIAMSGSALNNWTITRNPLPLAHKQADLLDCPTDDSQNMVDCIKGASAGNITLASEDLYFDLVATRNGPHALLTPVIESGNDDSEKFISYDPLELLQEGDFANVPLMIGTTRDELAYKARELLLYYQRRTSKLFTDWNTEAPKMFSYEPNDEVSEKIREFYLGSTENPVAWNSSVGLERLYADLLSIFGVVRTARLISEKSSRPVYLYQFNYESKLQRYESDSYEDLISQNNDAPFIFRTRDFPSIDDSKKDGQCSDRLITLWINFMDTGNPTPEASAALDNVIWKPFETNDPSYLDIKENLTLVKGIYYQDRIDFWEKLFPL